MLLGQLQRLLSDLYALDVSYDVYDFLITDSRLAASLDVNGRIAEEKLLISEEEDTAGVSLYVQADVLERLRANDPALQLDDGNLEDFWTALEGISHFVYYAWNADLDKSVTLLEMELQAEVDKFVATSLLLHRQRGPLAHRVHQWLFARSELDERLSARERTRYRDAIRYAGRYCRALARRLASGRLSESMKAELRHFYRLPQPDKIRHIRAS